MTPLSAFLTRLNPLVPSCPEPTALTSLVDSATEFCDATRAVRETVEVGVTRPGTATYDLDVAQGMEVAQVQAVWLGKRPLQLAPEAQRTYAEVAHLLQGDPQFAYLDGGHELVLYPEPEREEPLRVRVALRPLPSATALPDPLYSRWREAIVSGAAARLMMIPGQAFTSPELAAVYRGAFLREVSRGRVEANRGPVGVPPHVRPRPFA